MKSQKKAAAKPQKVGTKEMFKMCFEDAAISALEKGASLSRVEWWAAEVIADLTPDKRPQEGKPIVSDEARRIVKLERQMQMLTERVCGEPTSNYERD